MPKPHPVLLLVRELGIGGCERDTAKMAKYLDRERFTPHVGCFRHGLRTAELVDAGIPVFNIPVTSFSAPLALARAANIMGNYMKRNGIEVVHAYDYPSSFFGVPVARFYRAPAVISSNLGFRDMAERPLRGWLTVSDRLSDRIVVNSKAALENLVAYAKVAQNKTFLCYNGVETALFYPQKDTLFEPFRGSELVIGTVCALRPEKRVDLLIAAFARLRRPGWKLAIVGSGAMLESLQSLAASLGVADACHFEPSVTDVIPWMRAMDVFVLCSNTESFPNSLLEAMACGCCPVGTRVGGVPELIEDGRSGVIVDPENVEALAAGIEAVTSNAERRRALADAAAERARTEFSMERAARRTGELYEELLRRRNRWDA